MYDFALVLVGKYPGRESPQDVTIFKSLGLGIEDIALADLSLAPIVMAPITEEERP